jgi:signal transduction histidine kinase
MWMISAALLIVVVALAALCVHLRVQIRRTERIALERGWQVAFDQRDLGYLSRLVAQHHRDRQVLGQEMLDRLGSLLSVAKFRLSDLGERSSMNIVEKSAHTSVIPLIDDAVTEVRRLSLSMVRETLPGAGLKTALMELEAAVSKEVGCKVEMDLYGLEEGIDQRSAIMVHRIVWQCICSILGPKPFGTVGVHVTRSSAMVNIIVEHSGMARGTMPSLVGTLWQDVQRMVGELGGHILVDPTAARTASIAIDIPLLRRTR